jgi:hypothetical protein
VSSGPPAAPESSTGSKSPMESGEMAPVLSVSTLGSSPQDKAVHRG